VQFHHKNPDFDYLSNEKIFINPHEIQNFESVDMTNIFYKKKLTQVNGHIYRTVLILGGLNNDPSHSDFQKEIDDMIQIGAENDDVNQSSFYKEFLCNIKYKDVCFNMGSVSQAETGEANVDLIVDRYLKEDNPIIYIIQNVTKFHGDNLIVGVLIIEIKTNKCQFMVDMSATQDNHSKIEFLFNISE